MSHGQGWLVGLLDVAWMRDTVLGGYAMFPVFLFVCLMDGRTDGQMDGWMDGWMLCK